MKRFLIAFHVVAYYVAWFVCVLTASDGNPWQGAFIAFLIVATQVILQSTIQEQAQEP